MSSCRCSEARERTQESGCRRPRERGRGMGRARWCMAQARRMRRRAFTLSLSLPRMPSTMERERESAGAAEAYGRRRRSECRVRAGTCVCVCVCVGTGARHRAAPGRRKSPRTMTSVCVRARCVLGALGALGACARAVSAWYHFPTKSVPPYQAPSKPAHTTNVRSPLPLSSCLSLAVVATGCGAWKPPYPNHPA